MSSKSKRQKKLQRRQQEQKEARVRMGALFTAQAAKPDTSGNPS
jgi:hypothetical protein